MTNPSEEQFEAAVCASLVGPGGYTGIKNYMLQGEPRDFDPVRGLDTVGCSPFSEPLRSMSGTS